MTQSSVTLQVPKSLLPKLAKLGLNSRFDLILHLPLRYEDETHLYPIRDVPFGSAVQVEGEVIHAEVQYRRRKALICQVQDASGVMYIRFLHFYPSQVKTLQSGTRVRLFGEVKYGFFGPEMIHPQYRIVKESMPLAESLTPIYPITAGLSQSSLRELIKRALEESELTDTLPVHLLQKLQLPEFSESIKILHQPTPDIPLSLLQEKTHPAWRRLKFDELLAQQLSLRQHRAHRRSQGAPAFNNANPLKQQLLDALPFPLTAAQHRVSREIENDLTQPYPMHRLLQGDVGSGKTIVAAIAATQAVANGFQVAVMAPTEILSEQHYHKFSAWLAPLNINVAWLTSNMNKKEKRAALESIKNGTAHLVVGTHALFQGQVEFSNLGLAIIDEQHRFGVEQRLLLHQKGKQPHQLMMSATPIPRTLSMSYYADLDVAVIDQLPPGRTPVATKLVADSRRDEVLDRIREACRHGKQAYWVCPLIEESEALELTTAVNTFNEMQQIFNDLSVGLIHGRLAGKDKAAVMEKFKSGAIQLLVATTVIEVGVDVPNASLMVIEHAERMGLSQLHQLRGRVGRGTAQSTCILLYQTPLSEVAKARLKIIYENTDGFEVAKQDLYLRGPGEFLGARQSGVPMLRIADLRTDQDLLEATRATADELLTHYPEQAARHIARWLPAMQEYLKV